MNDNMTGKVVVVSVTFNDFEFISRQLKYLLKQSIEVYKIVIVDNNSSDENKVKLKKLSNKNVDIVWLEQNSGGAGGFEMGMKYAREKYDPDWYWLMDADAYPRENCLEKLLSHVSGKDNIGVVTPVIYGDNLQEYQLYHHKYVSKFLYSDLMIFQSSDMIPDTCYIEANAFVGPLISRRVVENMGYPDGSLFIYGDDLEYTYRISRNYKIMLVKEAVINHRDQPVYGKQRPENWWKDYYQYRNRVLFIRKYKISFFQEVIGLTLLCFRIFKQIMKAFLFETDIKMKRLRIKTLIFAVLDGLQGMSGKTVDPNKYKEHVLNNKT